MPGAVAILVKFTVVLAITVWLGATCVKLASGSTATVKLQVLVLLEISTARTVTILVPTGNCEPDGGIA